MDPVPIDTSLGGLLCSQCHQRVAPGAYFCANCGKELHEPPPSTSVGTQALMYGLSIILPVICIGMKSWPAFKYAQSPDAKARRVGFIAIGLMIASTIFSVWYGYKFYNELNAQVQAQVNTMLDGSGDLQ